MNYNVWSTNAGNWIVNITPLNTAGVSGNDKQDPANPKKLTYPQARYLYEYYRNDGVDYVWVRELKEDDVSPGSVVGYNLWIVGSNRWTNARLTSVGLSGQQIPRDPVLLSYPQAQKLQESLINVVGEIKEIGADLTPRKLHIPPDLTQGAATIPVAPVIAPAPTPVAASFDWNAYNGTTTKKVGAETRLRIMYGSNRDTYTGLPLKPKETS